MPQTTEKKQKLYFNILKKMRKLESKAQEFKTSIPPETENLYLLAFIGLLREGYPYNRKSHIEMDDFVPESPLIEKTEEKEKKKKGLFGSSKKQKPDSSVYEPINNRKDRETIFTITHNGDVFECKERKLSDMFGTLFTDLVYSKDGTPVTTNTSGGIKLIQPNFDEEDPDDIPEEDMFSKKKMTEKKNRRTIPIIQNNPNLPDDPYGRKSDDSFLYDKYELAISVPQDGKMKQKTCMVFIYPLIMTEQDTIISDIMVYVEDSDNRIRAKSSSVEEGDSKIVTIDFTQYKLYIKGRWEKGEFISEVILEDDKTQKNKAVLININKSEIRPEKKTSSYYQRIKGKTGEYLDVFPLTIGKNIDETGIAPVAVILEDSKDRSVLTRAGNGVISVIFEGKKKTVTSYWEGSELITEVEDFKNELNYD